MSRNVLRTFYFLMWVAVKWVCSLCGNALECMLYFNKNSSKINCLQFFGLSGRMELLSTHTQTKQLKKQNWGEIRTSVLGVLIVRCLLEKLTSRTFTLEISLGERLGLDLWIRESPVCRYYLKLCNKRRSTNEWVYVIKKRGSRIKPGAVYCWDCCKG